MKVYSAERHYDCAGFSIIGIFTTKEAAQFACDNDFIIEREIESPLVNLKYGDYHEVNEYDLKES